MADGDMNTRGVSLNDGAVELRADDSGSVSLPDGHSLSDASFDISGGDLHMEWPDGSRVTVDGFAETSPNLIDGGGMELPADMARQLAQIDAPDAPQPLYNFDMGSDVIMGTDGSPIGNVESIDGSVWAARVDGTRVELNVGDPVYQGDTIESGSDGSIGIILADETTFSMGEDGLMVLDEMIYDPATQEGSVSLSALEGVFTFVSGQVAKTDPDAMTIDTPVATIGIRGTQLGINLDDEGGLSVVLMEEADGFIGEVVVQNEGGVVILNTAFSGTNVGDYGSAPAASVDIDRATFLQNFGSALKALPATNNANTYGVEEANLEMLIEEAIVEVEQAAEEQAAEEQAVEEQAAEEEPAAEDVAEEQAAEEQTAEEEAIKEEVEPEPELEPQPEPEPEPLTILAPESDPVPITTPGPITPPDPITTTEPERRAPEPEPEPEPEPDPPWKITSPENPGERWNVEPDPGGVPFIAPDDRDYFVQGGQGADIITTRGGDDFIYGGDGDDEVNAGAGNDIIQGGTGRGNDKYTGGEGADWVIYPSATSNYALLIDLDAGTAVDADSVNFQWIDSDTLVSIENVLAGEGDDVITGSDADNVLVGNLGDDTLYGGAGNDTLIGGSNYDNNTIINGRNFVSDSLAVNDGGNDYLDGGDGIDTAVYSGSFSDYTIDVNGDNKIIVTGPDGSFVDTLVSIEKIQFSESNESSVVGFENSEISVFVDPAIVDSIVATDTITVSGIPVGAVLKSGEDIITVTNGVATVSEAQLANLTITPLQDSTTTFTLDVTVKDSSGTPTNTESMQIKVISIAEAPEILVSSTTVGLDDSNTVEFDLSASVSDVSESITSVVVSGVPAGGKLFVLVTDQNGNPQKLEIALQDGVHTIPIAYVGTVYVDVPNDVTEDFDLVLSSTSTESEGGDTATSSVTVTVDIPQGTDTTGTDAGEVIAGSSSDETIYGLDGDDTITGEGGTDTLYAGGGNDTVTGGVGVDTIHGNSGDDTLYGMAGDDTIIGGSGTDTLEGGAGTDTLEGGAGADTLTGGAGADTFVFDANSGTDIIKDIMNEDAIIFEGQEFNANDLIFSENADGDVEIAFTGAPDTKVTLEGIKTADLDLNNDGDLSEGYTVTETDGQVTVTIDQQS